MQKKNKYNLKKHKLGFYQIYPLPNQKNLEKYYREKYYQKPEVSTYSKSYSGPELCLGKIACEVTNLIASKMGIKGSKNVFDIGCGEGFFLQGLKNLKWKISGTDFSCEGVRLHNPNILKKIQFGPAEIILKKLKQKNKKFNLINLGNILEHVIDPVLLLKEVYPLLEEKGILRVVVPNDKSGFQALLKKEKRSHESWIHPPDHLSYFNFETLCSVLTYCKFKPIYKLGDFPIEIFLLNKYSNYENRKKYGAEAHFVRVKTVNYVRSRGIVNYIQWASGLAAGGTSRSCIVFAKKAR